MAYIPHRNITTLEHITSRELTFKGNDSKTHMHIHLERVDRTLPLREQFKVSKDHSENGYTLQLNLKIKTLRSIYYLPKLEVHLGSTRRVFFLARNRLVQQVTLSIASDDLNHSLHINMENGHLEETISGSLTSIPTLNGPIMIIAPHPDDAEIAAGGLYTNFSNQISIVTVSAGESLKKLGKQYLHNLDADLADASRRKGELRTWNSATVPMLSGVSPDKLVMLGMPDGKGWEIIAQNIASEPSLPLASARRFNRLDLPGDQVELANRDVLVQDLAYLLSLWQPETILVTDPEYDPHHDHIACALLLGMALDESKHIPQQILLYANHWRDSQHPLGPAFHGVWTPPLKLRQKLFKHTAPVAIPLSLEQQKHKAVLLDAMSDLSDRHSLKKRYSRALRGRFFPHFARGRSDYFQWSIRSDELFQRVTAKEFINGIKGMLRK